MGALNGITILDLSRVLAGPFCTKMLGDMGAEVIKVEGSHNKDDTREWGPPFVGGESAYYLAANRNKRAITLNLKSEKGKEVVKQLVRDADVVVQNFKTGTLDKLGMGYGVLKEINPKIILASITGFGNNGPYKDDAGYDYIIQAMGGLMSITGDESSGPLKVGVAIADVLTGLYTTIGILAALHERIHSGQGQCIDISVFDSQIAALVNIASNYHVTGAAPKRLGNQHLNIVPYQVFPTADQEMVVAVGNDTQFRKFTRIISLAELADDEKFSTNARRVAHKDQLVNRITAAMKKRGESEWTALLKQAGVPNGPINDMKALFEDPQVHARQMVVETAHPTAETVRLVGSPLKLSRTRTAITRHPPLYGEHTDQVLQKLGYSIEDIRTMREKEDI